MRPLGILAILTALVVGNPRSHIYFWEGCPNFAKLHDDNGVEFASADAAKQAGYRASRNCHYRGYFYHRERDDDSKKKRHKREG